MEKKKKYDVFLSYRRDGGSETAKLIRDALTEKGYRVFLDVESLRSGPFNTELYNVIEHSTDFVLILPPNGLARCSDEKDWVRLELEHASKCGKNIIPVMMKGFTFPEELPKSIDFIRHQNGLTATTDYFDAFVDHLVEFLKSKHMLPRSKRWIPIAAAVLLVGILTVIGIKYFSVYPRTNSQKNTVSELISYMSVNIKRFDMACYDYQDVLDRAEKYVQNDSNLASSEIKEKIDACIKNINAYKGDLTEMPDDLMNKLDSSPFDAGDIKANFIPALSQMCDLYTENLVFVHDVIVSDDSIPSESRTIYLEQFKEMAKLDAEVIFLELNRDLLPVTNEESLISLKRDILPEMKAVFAAKPAFSTDIDEIEGKQNAINNQMLSCIDKIEAVQNDDPRFKEYIQDRAQLYIDISENYDLNAEKLKAQIERMKAELESVNKEIEEKKKELYERKKPLETDKVEELLNKGALFLRHSMLKEAAECYEMCYLKCDEGYRPAVANALKFVKSFKELNLKGGIVVCGYEESKPHQNVEPGDIIIKINDKTISNLAEFADARHDGVNTIQILRFKDAGYDIVNSVYDSALGRLYSFGLTPDN